MLLVVDMQPWYDAAQCDRTQEEVITLVKKAKKNKERIIYLEYEGAGPTLLNIAYHTEDYPFLTKLKKDGNDGSDVILDYFGEVRPSNLDICGVNTGFCVKETALGLIKKTKPKIKVNLHLNACNHLLSTGEKDKGFSVEQLYGIEGLNVI